MAKNNPGLEKLLKIDARAKQIREKAGKKTVTVKVTKYNMKQTTAIKQAAKELRTASGRKSSAKKKSSKGQMKIKF